MNIEINSPWRVGICAEHMFFGNSCPICSKVGRRVERRNRASIRLIQAIKEKDNLDKEISRLNDDIEYESI